MTIFYVYEHWRPDKDTCFWVGKGKGDRAVTPLPNMPLSVDADKARAQAAKDLKLVRDKT